MRRRSLREYVEHYHLERNYQVLGNQLLVPSLTPRSTTSQIARRPRLGGSLNFYERAAARVKLRIRTIRAKKSVEPDPQKEKLAETRRHVEHGWSVVNDLLERDGQMQTARDVRRFLAQMRTPQTEQEQIAELIRTRSAGSRDDRDNRFG